MEGKKNKANGGKNILQLEARMYPDNNDVGGFTLILGHHFIHFGLS